MEYEDLQAKWTEIQQTKVNQKLKFNYFNYIWRKAFKVVNSQPLYNLSWHTNLVKKIGYSPSGKKTKNIEVMRFLHVLWIERNKNFTAKKF